MGGRRVSAPPPDPEHVAEAWYLVKVEGRTLRHVAQAMTGKLGRVPSASTIQRWVELGEVNAEWVNLLDIADARMRANARMEACIGWLVDELKDGTSTAVQTVPVIVAVERFRADLLGSWAKNGHAIGPEDAAGPNPAIAEAIRRARMRNAIDQKTIDGGGPDDGA
jgi:hypothetical protein